MADEQFSFDLAPVEVKYTIGGSEYTLREASGGAAKRYREASIAGARMTVNEDDNTRTVERMEGIGGLESLLVSLCLFDAKGAPVPRATVEGWPARIQRALFDKAKEISDLDEKVDLGSLRKQRERLDRQIAKIENKDAAKNA